MNAVIPLSRRRGHVYDIDLMVRFVTADFTLILYTYLAYSSVSFCSPLPSLFFIVICVGCVRVASWEFKKKT